MELLPSLGYAAGATAVGMYLNAKYHLYHDLSLAGIAPNNPFILRWVSQQLKNNRGLNFHQFEDKARSQPKHPFLIFEGRTYSYKEFYIHIVSVANWLMKDLGIERGEIVALDGGNSPEYVMLWMALDGIGAVPSFINCNLTSKSLLHCLQLCECRYLIADEDVRSNIDPHASEIAALGIQTHYYNPSFIGSLRDTKPIPKTRHQGFEEDDLRSLIYTSGTTGHPKAVRVTTGRDLLLPHIVRKYLQLTPTERMYTCMPLYHGAAHGLCFLPCIHAGATVVLGRKFSHQTFWPEVREGQATIMQYVGELCRYLLNGRPSEFDKKHKLRMAWGNGMRPDVWEPFRQRFGIDVINEMYGATDGVSACFNANKGEFGRHAIMVRGLVWRLFKGCEEKRVKIDADTEDIVRDPKTGFAVACQDGEPGEVLFRLEPKDPGDKFKGYYKNSKADNKRFINDVFSKGDLWFRSGDMHRMDPEGRTYFVDRLGDTFRWHSENVSTSEVADVLGSFPTIAEVNVYGVTVPRADGRCGAGAIVFTPGVAEDSFDFRELARWARDRLPKYAVPVFLRVTRELEYTGTLKVQKGRWKKEGVDPSRVGDDRLYWLPPDNLDGGYVPFREVDWEKVKAGKCKL